jgi:hypothetical protein
VVTGPRLVPLAAAALLAGCELYAVPDPFPCQGTKAATLNFSGTLRPNTCLAEVAQGANTSLFPFTGTLYLEADGGARLCREQPHAVPLVGTHAGDAVDVSHRNEGGLIQACTCALEVVETLRGSILRADGGPPTGFDGGLTSAVGPFVPGGGSPPTTPDGGVCNCQLPCALEYDVAAEPTERP